MSVEKPKSTYFVRMRHIHTQEVRGFMPTTDRSLAEATSVRIGTPGFYIDWEYLDCWIYEPTKVDLP